ncbi:hypothetical protein MAR_023464 [Mya arenaria]|uniref:Uncharacterized protein n=1 Tax=Mya arenaria TaxID=6604 RepID=A0ABY7DN10_MYAAR|nr:hypothetical protein MAR_023464 [Mya arenaria]
MIWHLINITLQYTENTCTDDSVCCRCGDGYIACRGPYGSSALVLEPRQASMWKIGASRTAKKIAGDIGEHKKDHDEKSQQTVPPEFWRLVHGPYSTCDAIGLGGVLAAGFHFHNCHFQYIKEKYRNPDLCTKCCIRPRFPIVHALPGLGPQSVRETPPQKPRQKHGDQKKPVGLRPRHNIQSYTPIVKSLWINEDDEIANEKAESKPTEAEKPIPKVDAAQKVETLESVFADFSDVCNKYTAIGKSIMGLQAAEDGNNKLAADLWQEACELGNTKAKFNLAVCYEHGKGVQKDQKEVGL